jgi:hypothetical protein
MKIYNIWLKMPLDKEAPNLTKNPRFDFPFPQDVISSMSPSRDEKDLHKGTVLSREYHKDGTLIVRFEWEDIFDEKGRLIAINEKTIYGITILRDNQYVEEWDDLKHENVKVYKKEEDWTSSINELEKRRKAIYTYIESEVKKTQFNGVIIGTLIHKRIFERYKDHLDKWLKQGWVNGLFPAMQEDINLLLATLPKGGIAGEFGGKTPQEIIGDLVIKSFGDNPSDTILKYCVAGYLLSPSETLVDAGNPELGKLPIVEYLKLYFYDYFINQD